MKPFGQIHNKFISAGVCPRCEGLIPSNDRHGQYMGATSRLTRDADKRIIEVCSDCGSEEALQEHFDGFATPVSDWPTMTREAIKRRSEAFGMMMEMTASEEEADGEEEPF